MDTAILDILWILCFVVGSGLIIVEAFIPGFGVAGVFGAILEIAGIWITGSRFGLGAGLLALLLVLLFVGTAVFLSYRSAVKGRLSKSPLVLQDVENPEGKAEDGDLVNRKGETATALRPAGFVLVDGARYSAVSEGDFLEKEMPVLVTGKRGSQLVVRKL